MTRLLTWGAALLLVAAPANAAPPRSLAEVPAQWPRGPAYAQAAGMATPAYGYGEVLGDPRLRRIIGGALAHNQDVAVAVANIAAARAQFQVQRASLFPELDAAASYAHAGGDGALAGATRKGDSLAADGTVASWEIDLFGRLQSLTAAQRAKWLGTLAAARGVRITLVAQIANVWLAYGADESLLGLANATANSARASLDLTRKRVAGGVAPLADQRKAEITRASAEADVAAQTTLLAQDLNALRMLAGADIAESDLPAGIDDAALHLAAVPAGLSSEILLRRPDVMEADQNLLAASANADAARAALFPRITLTGLAGVASTALTGLFTGGNFAWSGGAGVVWPIFSGGKARGGLALARAQQDAALASWRKSVQAAFRDVADVLARRGTITAQLAFAMAGRDAAVDNARLTERRYNGGIASAIDNYTSQQAAYVSERTLVATRLVDATSRVGLYRALGGDDPLAGAGSASAQTMK